LKPLIPTGDKEMSEITLKPCPFCGNEADLIRPASTLHCVKCSNQNCDVRPKTVYHNSVIEAIKAWNSRPSQEPLTELKDRVVEAGRLLIQWHVANGRALNTSERKLAEALYTLREARAADKEQADST
jgi:ssDNA-binding Zn-finger/Zn-ribbon topoisomerase 1